MAAGIVDLCLSSLPLDFTVEDFSLFLEYMWSVDVEHEPVWFDVTELDEAKDVIEAVWKDVAESDVAEEVNESNENGCEDDPDKDDADCKDRIPDTCAWSVSVSIIKMLWKNKEKYTHLFQIIKSIFRIEKIDSSNQIWK